MSGKIRRPSMILAITALLALGPVAAAAASPVPNPIVIFDRVATRTVAVHPGELPGVGAEQHRARADARHDEHHGMASLTK